MALDVEDLIFHTHTPPTPFLWPNRVFSKIIKVSVTKEKPVSSMQTETEVAEI